ncbi:hypothetical protein FACS1894181_19040 [Bacteroidia bacterium]|nr:hypothetical protein FACS1894181_19040 [Bacteroidia bacterium]
MKTEFWDKESEINGCPSDCIFKSHPEMKNGSVLLVKDEKDTVCRIESVKTLKSVYGWKGKTDEEVSALFLEELEKQQTTEDDSAMRNDNGVGTV